MATLYEFPFVLLFLFVCITAISTDQSEEKKSEKPADGLTPNLSFRFRNPLLINSRQPRKTDKEENQNGRVLGRKYPAASSDVAEVPELTPRLAHTNAEIIALESDVVHDNEIKNILTVHPSAEIKKHGESESEKQPVSGLRQRFQRDQIGKHTEIDRVMTVPGKMFISKGTNVVLQVNTVNYISYLFTWEKQSNEYGLTQWSNADNHNGKPIMRIYNVTQTVTYRVTVEYRNMSNTTIETQAKATVFVEDDMLSIIGNRNEILLAVTSNQMEVQEYGGFELSCCYMWTQRGGKWTRSDNDRIDADWYHNGKLISQSPNHTFWVNNATQMDSGRYWSVPHDYLYNTIGFSSKAFMVTVRPNSGIKCQPQMQTVEEGKTASTKVVRLDGNDFGNNVTFSWNKPWNVFNTKYRTMINNTNQVWIIPQVHKDDSRTFVVTVKFADGFESTATTKIIVTESKDNNRPSTSKPTSECWKREREECLKMHNCKWTCSSKEYTWCECSPTETQPCLSMSTCETCLNQTTDYCNWCGDGCDAYCNNSTITKLDDCQKATTSTPHHETKAITESSQSKSKINLDVTDHGPGGEATKKLTQTPKKSNDTEDEITPASLLNSKLESGKLNVEEMAEKMGKDENIQKLVKDMFTGKHTDSTEPVKPEFRAKVPEYIEMLAKKYTNQFPKSASMWKIAKKIAQDSDEIQDQVARMLEKMDKAKKGITTDEAVQKTFDKMKSSPELTQLDNAVMDNFEDNFQVDKNVKENLKSNFTKMFEELGKQSKKADETDNKNIGKKFVEKQVEPTKDILKSLTKSIKLKLPDKRRQRRQAPQNQIDAVREYARQLMTLVGLPAEIAPLQDLLEGILNAAANAPANSPLKTPMADLQGTGPNGRSGSNAATNDVSLNNGQNSLDLGKQLTTGLNNMNNADDPPGGSYWWIGVIVGVVVVLVIVIVVVIFLVAKKKKEKPVDEAVVLVVVAADEPDLISETMSDQVNGPSYISLPGTSLPPTQVETEPTQPSVEENQQIINVNIIHVKADGSDSITDDTDTDDVVEETAVDETSVPFTEDRKVFKDKKKVKRSEKKKKQEDKKQKRETKTKEVEEKSKDLNQQIIIIHDDSQPAKDKDETPQTTQDSEDKTKNQQQQQIIVIHQNAPPEQNSSQPDETQSASKDVKQRNILIVNDNQPKSNGEKYESVVQRNPVTYQQVTNQKTEEKQPENQETKEVRYLELTAVPSETKSKVKSIQQKESSQKISKLKDEPSVKLINVVSSKSKTQSVKDKQTKSVKDVASQQTKEVKQKIVMKAHEEPRYEPVGGTEDDVDEQEKKPKSVSENKEPKKETVITVTTITTTNQDGVEVTDVQ